MKNRSFRTCLLLAPDVHAPAIHKYYRLPPSGPAVVAAVARRIGQEMVVEDLCDEVHRRHLEGQASVLLDEEVVNAHLTGKSNDHIAELVDSFIGCVRATDADAFAFSTERHTQATLALLVGLELKRRYGRPIAIGGTGAKACGAAAEALGVRGIDFITGAASPTEISRVLQTLAETDPRRNECASDPIASRCNDAGMGAEDWPVPDYGSFELWRYRNDPFRAERDRFPAYDGSVGEELVLVYNLAFGCQYHCSFCQTVGTQAAKSMAANIAALREMSERYETRNFFFVDTQMNLFADAFCQAVIDAGLGIRWSNSYRVSPGKLETLDRMAEAGCIGLTYGIESASPQVLRRMRKGHTPERATEVVSHAHSLGIYNRVNLLSCFPGETPDDFRMTLDWLAACAPCIDDLAPSSFYLTEGSPVGDDPELFGVRVRGKRSLTGVIKYRKLHGALEFDEVHGYRWEDREPMLAASENELRETWVKNRSFGDIGGQMTPKLMFAAHHAFSGKAEAYETFGHWRGRGKEETGGPPDYERPSRQSDLLALELGLRDSALVEVSNDDLSSLASEFGTIRTLIAAPHREGSDTRLLEGGEGTRRAFAIVSRRSDLPSAEWFREIWDSRTPTAHFDGEERDADQLFGTLLGYPECCVEWYRAQAGDAAVVRSNFRYAERALARTAPGRAHFGLNWLFHDYFQLVSHRPCSFSCEASVARAARFFDALRMRYPGFAAELRATLGAHVVVFDTEDYVAFVGDVQGEAPGTIKVRIDAMVRERLTDDARRGLYGALVPGAHFSVEPGAVLTDGGEWPLAWGRDVLVISFGSAGAAVAAGAAVSRHEVDAGAEM